MRQSSNSSSRTRQRELLFPETHCANTLRTMQEAFRHWKPPPRLTVSEWADGERHLSQEASASPGRWKTSNAEYAREIMDTISQPGQELTVVMSSAQIGKTEILLNVIGYHIHQDPAPILALQPTLDMAETFSKDRVAPMLRDTPVLAGRVADAKSRNNGNTLLHKKFDAGHLTIVGANSPSGLASRPIRILLADEVDRYPDSAGTEGDPLSLAIKRTTTFFNRRIVVVSTPTIKGLSRVEAEWERSDQRKFHVPCKHCGSFQVLEFNQVRWPEGLPDEAAYHCKDCDEAWLEGERIWSVRNGEWQATHPDRRVAGFHICELYSPWSSMAQIARSFVAAKANYETRKTWVNTVLGEPFEEEAARLDAHFLSERVEDWGDHAPDDVLVVTCGVDVQGDRFEVERVGWCVDERSYSLDHHVIWGDPSDPAMWRRLDAYLLQPTIRHDGRELPVRTTCVDSGGHHTQAVYKFCKLRKSRRIFAIKGRAGPIPVWPSALRKTGKDRAAVTIVGIDAAKDAIYSYLRLPEVGPGFCHFPKGRSLVWFEQLTSEIVQTKYSRGFPTRVYVLPEHKRNEALDCRVYAYAALQSLGVRWGTEVDAMESEATPPVDVSAEVADRKLQEERPRQFLGRNTRAEGGFGGRNSRRGGW